jgi:hypothetical protein
MVAPPIEGKTLTSWSVLPGGVRSALHFNGMDDAAHCVVLPVDALPGLMMTLPSMFQCALDERFPKRSFRIVHRIARWQLEREASRGELILKLQTQDGFEVAIDLDHQHPGSLAADLQEVTATPDADRARKPD